MKGMSFFTPAAHSFGGILACMLRCAAYQGLLSFQNGKQCKRSMDPLTRFFISENLLHVSEKSHSLLGTFSGARCCSISAWFAQDSECKFAFSRSGVHRASPCEGSGSPHKKCRRRKVPGQSLQCQFPNNLKLRFHRPQRTPKSADLPLFPPSLVSLVWKRSRRVWTQPHPKPRIHLDPSRRQPKPGWRLPNTRSTTKLSTTCRILGCVCKCGWCMNCFESYPVKAYYQPPSWSLWISEWWVRVQGDFPTITTLINVFPLLLWWLMKTGFWSILVIFGWIVSTYVHD